MRRFAQYVQTIPVILLAAYLRTVEIGRGGLSIDEAVHILRALPITRGELVFTGVPSSVGLWHPPFPLYVFTIPAFFSLDPRLERLWIAALNLFAVCLAYLIGKRYFSHRAGLIAALLYAFHPIAIAAARHVWVPNVPLPLVFLYTLSGLMGYYEAQDHPRARLLHLPMLSLAAQCHELAALLAPVTLILVVYGWIAHSARRRQFVRDTLISGLIAAALWIPWAIGMIRYFQQTGGAVQEQYNFSHNYGLQYLLDTIIAGLGGWPDHPTWLWQPILTLIGGAWLITRAARPKGGMPGLVIVLVYLLVPVLSLLLDLPYREYHHRPSYAHAFLIQGAALDALLTLLAHPRALPWGARTRRALSLVPALILIAVLMPAQLQQFGFDLHGDPRIPLRDVMDAAAEGVQRSRESGRVLLIMTPTQDGSAEPLWQWEVIHRWALSQGADSRTVWQGWGIPLPPPGAILLLPEDYPIDARLVIDADESGPRLRLAELDPDSIPLEVRPLEPARFSNGVAVLGFESEPPTLEPGAVWPVWMVWRIDSVPPDQYTAFLHLVDADGNKIAQADQPTRPLPEWQAGDVVANRFELVLGDHVPASGPLYFRFGMYDPSEIPAELIDDAGQHVGRAYDLIQVRGGGIGGSSYWLAESLVLDSFQTSAPLSLGEPLEVRLTWHTRWALDQDWSMRWRLIDPAGDIVFEQTGEPAPNHPTSSWPAGNFIPGFYFLRLPTGLPAASYSLELQLLGAGGDLAGPPRTERVEIVADRARRYDAPDFAHAVGADFADHLTLLGYDAALDGHSLTLTLHWQATDTIQGNYNYFVHIAQGDQVFAQADGAPGGGRTPTFWWAPGEVISETITLDLSALPPGTYAIRTGFYDLVTLERLAVTLPDGSSPPDQTLTLQPLDID